MVIGKVAGAAFDVTVGPLITAMDKLKDVIRDTFEFADRAQKASLALGKTYEETGASLGGTMQGLRGDLNQRFAAGIAGMEAGLQGNTAGVAKLINQQMLTGTAYKQTAKAFASLEVGLNLSRDETNVLASNLIDIGDTWEISTDNLVKSLDALKDTLPAQKLAGMGKDMMEAIAQFKAELGPAMTKPLNRIMNMIFDTSQEGYARLAALGMVNIREQLSASKGVTTKVNLMKEAFGTGADRVKSFTVNADKLFLMIGAAERAFGKPSLDLTTIMDALGDRIAKVDGTMADYGKTLKNLWKEALVPFQEGLIVAYPFFLEVINVISGVLNIIGKKFKAFTEGLGDGSEAIVTFQIAFIDLTIYLLGKFKGVFAVMETLFTEGIPWLFNKFQSVIYDIIRPGGTITGLQYAFHTVTAALFSFSEYLNVWDGDREKEIEKQIVIHENLANVSKALIDNTKWLQKPRMGWDTLDYVDSDAKRVLIFKGLLNTFENSQKLLAGKGGTTNPLALMAEKAAALQAAAMKNDPTIKALYAARASLEDGNGFARETNFLLAEAQANLQAIDDKTPDLTTGSMFLDETANMLGRSIEGILGVGRDTTAEEMLEELREANLQRAKAAITGGASLSGRNPNSPPL